MFIMTQKESQLIYKASSVINMFINILQNDGSLQPKRPLKDYLIPVVLIIGLLFLGIGVMGVVVPDSFYAPTVNCYITSGVDLKVQYGGPESDMRVHTNIHAPSHGSGGDVFAMIHGQDYLKEIYIDAAPPVSVLLEYPDRNVTIQAKTYYGLTVDTDIQSPEVERVKDELTYRVFLVQNGSSRMIVDENSDGSVLPSRYSVNLLDFEAEHNITPPYTLNCSGWITYRHITDIDEYRSQTPEYTERFWRLDVEENSTLRVTRYADVPVEQVQLMNPTVRSLKDAWGYLVLFGVVFLVFYARGLIQ